MTVYKTKVSLNTAQIISTAFTLHEDASTQKEYFYTEHTEVYKLLNKMKNTTPVAIGRPGFYVASYNFYNWLLSVMRDLRISRAWTLSSDSNIASD